MAIDTASLGCDPLAQFADVQRQWTTKAKATEYFSFLIKFYPFFCSAMFGRIDIVEIFFSFL